MRIKNRILSISLMNKIKRQPEYAKQLGIEVQMIERKDTDNAKRKAI